MYPKQLAQLEKTRIDNSLTHTFALLGFLQKLHHTASTKMRGGGEEI